MTENETKVVKVLTTSLRPNVYNPNQQSLDSFELLVKSIEEDGFTLPVVVNSGETNSALRNMIIDGEHRWRAAQVLEMIEVPVVFKDMDEAEMRASTIRHNKARGHHDPLLEAQVLKELVGQMDVEELKASLNLDDVEMSVMLDKAESFTSADDIAQLIEGENLDELASQNLTGEHAQTVARRHAIIDSGGKLSEQDSQTLENESGQNVRIELIYSGEAAEFMRSFVRNAGSPREAILSLVSKKGVTDV